MHSSYPQSPSVKLSVIIPTYNRAELLGYTLRSLVLQDLDKDLFEVIVCDDGSSDDSEAVTAAFAGELRVSYLYQDDLGFRPSSTRNMGIRAAGGEVCVFLDGGIIAGRSCLSAHLDFHTTKKLRAAAIGYIYGLNENERIQKLMSESFQKTDPGALIPLLEKEEAFGDVREKHYQLHGYKLQDLPAPWVYFWSGHISVPTTRLLEIGMFDEGYDGKWGIEDNDLGYRLHQAGTYIHLLRDAKAFHFSHHSHKPHKELQGRENCVYFHNKYQTNETALFLEHFGSPEFFDLNMATLSSKV